MRMLKSPKKNIVFIVSAMMLSLNAQAQVFEFDSKTLEMTGLEDVDLSSFSGTNSEFASTQNSTIKLNGETILTNYNMLSFSQDGQEEYCLTPDFLRDIYVKDSYIKKAERQDDNHQTDVGLCLNMQEIIPDISFSYHEAGNNLEVTIPQAYLNNIDPSWVRPSQRDSGISGLIFDYNLLWNLERSKQASGSRSSTTYTSVYGTLGANIGWLRIRGEYQYQSKKFADEDKLQWNQVYGYTDLASLNSKLYMGETYSRSNVFDSVRIKGVSLFSDESMMPSYLKGYAPEITGTAFSDAVVTVSQFGAILSKTQVPAGPFVISNLPSYVNGVVSVSIEENNGEIRTYEVEVSQVPFLTRKGTYRYNASFGKIDPLVGTKVGTNLFSGDISYGLTSDISVFGGVQHTTNSEFRAINLGLGLNLHQFGAISFDVTHSKSDIKGLNDRRTGQSYRFNYAKRFSAGTTLNLAGYRFSSSGFRGVSDYISLKQHIRSENSGMTSHQPYYEKNRVSVSVSQYIEPADIYISGTISTGTYWNRPGNNSSYNISIGKTIKTPGLFENTSLNLSLSQDKYDGGDNDKRIALFVTIPLGEDRGSLSYNGGYSSSSKRIDQQVRYNNHGLGGDYSIGVNTNNKRDFSGSIDYSLTGYYNTNTRYGTATTSFNHTKNYDSVRAGYNGSMTLTQHGLATHGVAYGPETSRLILDAGAPNVQLGNDSSKLKSNTFGLIGVPSVSPYSFVSYSVNNDNLPNDVQITDSVVNLAVDTGAIAYRSLGGIRGETALSIISLRDGSHPPFGAMVYRENGDNTEVAIVAEGGLTYIMGLQPDHKYTVKWNGSSSCDLKIPSLNPDDLKNLTCY